MAVTPSSRTSITTSSTAPTTTAFGRRPNLRSLSRRPRPSASLGWGLGLLGGLILFSLLAPVFGAPDKIYANGISAHGLPLPFGSTGHLLGTDSIGRDMLARLAYGGRTTLAFTF